MSLAFYKYQSLGNDFVVFDWYTEQPDQVLQTLTNPAWPQRVIALCNRHTGVGADGVLVITIKNKQPFMCIFNADGTQAESCLNGLRCVAQHLITNHNIAGVFAIGLDKKDITCTAIGNAVRTVIPGVIYQEPHSLSSSAGVLHGHKTDAGNPHFIVFKEVSYDWLACYGKELESHVDFPNKANVSFVWRRDSNSFSMLTFERGCGITQACSSAAAAVLKTLASLEQIKQGQEITLYMLGGLVFGYVDPLNNIVLQAQAQQVFKGEITG